MQTAYVAIIEKGVEGYGVFFPDIPGLTSYGASPGEAAANAAIAAQGHVALVQEMGEQLAPATALEDIEVDDDVQEVSRVMILVETADEKQRVNITLPKSVLAALDGIAGLRGQDRSSMIADLVRDYCQAPRDAAISAAPSPHAFADSCSSMHLLGKMVTTFTDQDHAWSASLNPRSAPKTGWSIFGRKPHGGHYVLPEPSQVRPEVPDVVIRNKITDPKRR